MRAPARQLLPSVRLRLERPVRAGQSEAGTGLQDSERARAQGATPGVAKARSCRYTGTISSRAG